MKSWWQSLLEAQRRAGFPDLAGSEGTLQLTLSDALLNELVSARLPAEWPIAELALHALPGNEVAVRVRLRNRWLPPVQGRLHVDPQPVTPASPLLRLRLTSGLGPFLGVAASWASLPDWLRVSGDVVTVDVESLAAQAGFADLLPLLKMLTVATGPARVAVTMTLAVQ